jgi:hypothetical protein
VEQLAVDARYLRVGPREGLQTCAIAWQRRGLEFVVGQRGGDAQQAGGLAGAPRATGLRPHGATYCQRQYFKQALHYLITTGIVLFTETRKENALF